MLGLFWGAWFVCAIFTAVIASSRGRNGFGWFLLGALFGIFALIAAAAMPVVEKAPGERQPPSTGLNPLIVCPGCGVYVERGIAQCPKCQRQLIAPADVDETAKTIRCPKCLSYIKRDSNPCPWCGHRREIPKIECPHCHCLIPSNLNPCPRCDERR